MPGGRVQPLGPPRGNNAARNSTNDAPRAIGNGSTPLQAAVAAREANRGANRAAPQRINNYQAPARQNKGPARAG